MKILIVEDDESLRNLMQMHLADYGTCDLAANGLEAVEAVEQSIISGQPYDLACMDIIMPQMDGMEALRKIRRLEFKHFQEGLPSMKIIMITAKDKAVDIVSASRAGSEAYITKPFTYEQLIEQIRQLGLLDEPGKPEESDFAF